jgi:hypothetical protein
MRSLKKPKDINIDLIARILPVSSTQDEYFQFFVSFK